MANDIKKKIKSFFSSYPVKEYEKGRILSLSGDGSDYVYYLTSGRVKQYDVSNRGDEIIVNVFRKSAFFPMSIAINGGQDSYIYEAETDISFHQAPAHDAVEFIKKNPDVMLDLLSRIYRGLDGVLERMVHLMKGDARARLMFEIVVNSLRFGEENKDGSYLSEVTEGSLAARAGLTRETVSREMSKLAKEGLLEFKSGRLRVFEINKLKEKLDNWE